MLNNVFEIFSIPVFQRAFTAFLFVIAIILINKFLVRYINKTIKDSHIQYNARKGLKFVEIVVIIISLFLIFTQELKQFNITVGLIGAGIAIALQNMIMSLAGWFSIAFGQYFKIGDRIEINGIMGDVIDIDFFYTTIMECGQWIGADLYNGRIVKINNNKIINNPLYNYSLDFAFVWDEIKIPISYTSNVKLVQNILYDVVIEISENFIDDAEVIWKKLKKKYLLHETKLNSAVTIVVSDKFLEFTLRYIVDYKRRREIKDLIYNKLMQKFEEHKDQVDISTSSIVDVSSLPEININLRDKLID